MSTIEQQNTAYPPERRIALVDLLDRVLAGGVVIAGEVTLSLAGVDMVRVSLRALVSSVGALEAERPAPREADQKVIEP